MLAEVNVVKPNCGIDTALLRVCLWSVICEGEPCFLYNNLNIREIPHSHQKIFQIGY